MERDISNEASAYLQNLSERTDLQKPTLSQRYPKKQFIGSYFSKLRLHSFVPRNSFNSTNFFNFMNI